MKRIEDKLFILIQAINIGDGCGLALRKSRLTQTEIKMLNKNIEKYAMWKEYKKASERYVLRKRSLCHNWRLPRT